MVKNNKMNKFKIGDKVRVVKVTRDYGEGYPPNGCLGKIIDKWGVYPCYGVEFDKPVLYGHSCNGKGKDGHCYDITYAGHLELVEEEKIENSLVIKKTFMEKLKTISVKLRAALGDEKANQIIAGLRNDDLSLTSKGKDVVTEALADQDITVKALNDKASEIISEFNKK